MLKITLHISGTAKILLLQTLQVKGYEDSVEWYDNIVNASWVTDKLQSSSFRFFNWEDGSIIRNYHTIFFLKYSR